MRFWRKLLGIIMTTGRRLSEPVMSRSLLVGGWLGFGQGLSVDGWEGSDLGIDNPGKNGDCIVFVLLFCFGIVLMV